MDRWICSIQDRKKRISEIFPCENFGENKTGTGEEENVEMAGTLVAPIFALRDYDCDSVIVIIF
jgi:hypothetical protein